MKALKVITGFLVLFLVTVFVLLPSLVLGYDYTKLPKWLDMLIWEMEEWLQ